MAAAGLPGALSRVALLRVSACKVVTVSFAHARRGHQDVGKRLGEALAMSGDVSKGDCHQIAGGRCPRRPRSAKKARRLGGRSTRLQRKRVDLEAAALDCKERAPSWCAQPTAAKKTRRVGGRSTRPRKNRAGLVLSGPSRRDFFAIEAAHNPIAAFSLQAGPQATKSAGFLCKRDRKPPSRRPFFASGRPCDQAAAISMQRRTQAARLQ